MTGLPPELAAASVERLAWVALSFGATFAIFYLLHSWLGPEIGVAERRYYSTLTLVAVGAGLVVWWVARSKRLDNATVLDIGLVFQVLGGLLISLSETAAPFPAEASLRYNSMTAIWVVFFVLVVPSSLGKMVLASLATAMMGPLGLGANIILRGNPVPGLGHWMMVYAATFVMAAWSILLARYMHRLGQQAQRAKAMGSYELVELIGRGGMGEVWRARHRMLARESALKLIRPEALCCRTEVEMESARRRFEREARATAALHSPHTVAVHDYGVAEDGSFYYVMELLRGMDLDELVTRHGPVSAARTVYILRQVCESLAEAHLAGLTHRDIKPRNIFLCQLGLSYDFVKVLDFGLVKARAGGETQLTQEGSTTGTPAFMAPEMALGHHEVDARTDLYAVGCVAYWLLTGQLVFQASTALAMALAHVQTAPVAPSERTEIEVPAELDALILRCLAKEPAARPQSARELMKLLDAIPLKKQWTVEDAEEWWTTHLPPETAVIGSSMEGTAQTTA
jgi:serine/threonine-protein kinase